jgi:ribonuclease HI
LSLEVYTDGSCLKNPGGPGGWAYTFVYADQQTARASGPIRKTTSQRAEVIAAIKALSSLKERSDVTVVTDSNYLASGLNKRMYALHADGSLLGAANGDLWSELHDVACKHKVRAKHVSGHSGNKWNDWCDKEARHQATLPPPPQPKRQVSIMCHHLGRWMLWEERVAWDFLVVCFLCLAAELQKEKAPR